MLDSYLDAFAGLSADNMTQDELAVFKRVFLSEEGQFVLQRILEKCKFMELCENERDMERRNVATELLATIYWEPKTERIQMYRVIDFIKKKLKRRSHA